MVATAKRLQQLVDRLGAVKAKIADLQQVESKIKEDLIESGIDSIEGRLFRATVSRYDRKSVDWKKLAEALNASEGMIEAFSEERQGVAVRVVARNGKEK